MNIGTVEWFCPEQGFGVISSDKGDRNIFVHFSSIISEGFSSLVEGQKVFYDIKSDVRNSSKIIAVNVSIA